MVSYLFLDGDDLKSGLRALIPHWEPQKNMRHLPHIFNEIR